MRRSSVRIRFPAPFFLPFRHFPSGAQKVSLLFSDCVEVAIYVCCEVRTRSAIARHSLNALGMGEGARALRRLAATSRWAATRSFSFNFFSIFLFGRYSALIFCQAIGLCWG